MKFYARIVFNTTAFNICGTLIDNMEKIGGQFDFHSLSLPFRSSWNILIIAYSKLFVNTFLKKFLGNFFQSFVVVKFAFYA